MPATDQQRSGLATSVQRIQGTPSILLVDDDPAVIAVLSGMLTGIGQLRFASSGADALRLARKSVPDLVIMDVEMPGMSGFEVCAQMHQDSLLQQVPVIFVTSHDDVDAEVSGLHLGAVDYITKPPRAPLVRARVALQLRLKQLTDQLREAATQDALTGLFNRRVFDDRLPLEWQRGLRARTPTSLMIIDIDHFKAYNDHYGHPAGDRCLQAVAQSLRSVTQRPADLLARYGGEEFVLLLPDTHANGARIVATTLLGAVQALALPHAASPVARHMSISIGVSTFDETCRDWPELAVESRIAPETPRRAEAELLAAADQALYAAKDHGRARAHFLHLDDLGAGGQTFDVEFGLRQGLARQDVA
jgi:diguanylate cyclase (GGDEF)-like protein